MTEWGILSKVNDYEKVERLPFRWKINCLQEQQYSFIFQQKSKIKTITACCFRDFRDFRDFSSMLTVFRLKYY